VKRGLTASQHELLRTAVEKHAPSLLPLLDDIGRRLLTVREREELRLSLADELVETGLDEQDEHTPRGLEIEDVIDALWDVAEED
jgi:hypothetical protein